MIAYLVRHATPNPKDVDPKQGLSTEGRQEAAKAAEFIKNYHVSKVFHSGRKRAMETAGIIAGHVEIVYVVRPDGTDLLKTSLHYDLGLGLC